MEKFRICYTTDPSRTLAEIKADYIMSQPGRVTLYKRNPDITDDIVGVVEMQPEMMVVKEEKQ